MARVKTKPKPKSKPKMSNSRARGPTPQRIMEMAWGFAPPLILEAATRHKLFDAMDSGPKTADEIAQASGMSERGVRAAANALVSLGFLKKDSRQRYSLTPESSTFLVSTKPSYYGGFFRTVQRRLIPSWLE